jgi:hypothetical protein
MRYSLQEMAVAVERLTAPQREAVQRGKEEDRIRLEEREAIVRWLRQYAADARAAEAIFGPGMPYPLAEAQAIGCEKAAGAIERGEHLKPAEEGQGT